MTLLQQPHQPTGVKPGRQASSGEPQIDQPPATGGGEWSHELRAHVLHDRLSALWWKYQDMATTGNHEDMDGNIGFDDTPALLLALRPDGATDEAAIAWMANFSPQDTASEAG